MIRQTKVRICQDELTKAHRTMPVADGKGRRESLVARKYREEKDARLNSQSISFRGNGRCVFCPAFSMDQPA